MKLKHFFNLCFTIFSLSENKKKQTIIGKDKGTHHWAKTLILLFMRLENNKIVIHLNLSISSVDVVIFKT